MKQTSTTLFLIISIGMLAACDDGGIKPPCSSPAPLSYNNNDVMPGYVVFIKKGFNAKKEATRLQEKYLDLKVRLVNTGVNFFFGNSSDSTLLELRCERSVESVVYNKTESNSF